MATLSSKETASGCEYDPTPTDGSGSGPGASSIVSAACRSRWARCCSESRRTPLRRYAAPISTNYWNPEDFKDLAELVTAGLVWPLGLVAAALWFTWKNGAVIRQRSESRDCHQLIEEFGVYFSAGVLPPWYYAFELYNGRSSAKACSIVSRRSRLLRTVVGKHGSQSPLGDKLAFPIAQEVSRSGRYNRLQWRRRAARPAWSPVGSLRLTFLKSRFAVVAAPVAERWDYVSEGRYEGSDAQTLSRDELVEHLSANQAEADPRSAPNDRLR